MASSVESLRDPAQSRVEWAMGAETLTIDRVFRENFHHVYRIVGRLLGPSAPHSDIDDLTQQVFLVVFRALPDFRGESSLSTWLYGIACNVVSTGLRGFRRRRRLVRALELAASTPKSARTPEQAYADKQELVLVWKCLLRLKAPKRLVYVLFELEGLSGAEIAKVLDLPEATVFSRLHHARQEIARALKPIAAARREP